MHSEFPIINTLIKTIKGTSKNESIYISKTEDEYFMKRKL